MLVSSNALADSALSIVIHHILSRVGKYVRLFSVLSKVNRVSVVQNL
jgi:hypothetical protein